MQPTYLPWLGYFDLMRCCDVFVVYDTARFSRQSWQQRNRVKTATGPLWLSVPVHRRSGASIASTPVADELGWRRKHWETLRHAYAHARHAALLADLEPIFQSAPGRLAELNLTLIEWLAKRLCVRPKMVRASDLGSEVVGPRSETIVNICRAVGGDVYLTPAGAEAYLREDAILPAPDVEVRIQRYEHPVYPQLHGEFVPYLSAVDTVLNCGDAAADVLAAGSRFEPMAPGPAA
jgi:hypothetical protein